MDYNGLKSLNNFQHLIFTVSEALKSTANNGTKSGKKSHADISRSIRRTSFFGHSRYSNALGFLAWAVFEPPHMRPGFFGLCP